MDVSHAIDWVLHLDDHLKQMVIEHGAWTYLVLFGIVFCETGLVVAPFLPGDSLLFAAGAIAGSDATGSFRVEIVMFTLMAAALCGDNVNYWVGRTIGPKVFKREDSRWLKKKHLERTHRFFERYGGKAIILARFVPIVRTFTPFVAGVGSMHYPRFLRFCVLGAALWVGLLVMAGYWFGRIEWVKSNFEIVVVAIIVISLLPVVYELIQARRHIKQDATTRQERDTPAGGDA
ncbi:MAG TPA: DedA family protein [Phycisphaerales bacterium]|jgi:membrane-associated protein|nr:DedA family protein [Phycisphaerales bacterium]